MKRAFLMRLAILVVLVIGVGVAVAAPTTGATVSAMAVRPPTGKAMAQVLGFPKNLKFTMVKREKSAMFEGAQPIWVVTYAAEKQTPFFYSLELHKAGSLFDGKREEYEQRLEKNINEFQEMRREFAEEGLIKYGNTPGPENKWEKFADVEIRPGGRKVFTSVFGGGPGGGVSGAFTTVGEYDVILLQFASTGDGDDPEETERMRKMLYPTRSVQEAFAQVERVMPIFPQIVAEPNPQVQEAASKAAQEAAIWAAPAPSAPTGEALAKCLGFGGHVPLKASKAQYGQLFDQAKPLWVTDYHAPEQLGAYYSLALYPARSLFGRDRDWFEGWLEHPVPFKRTVRDQQDADNMAGWRKPTTLMLPGDLAKAEEQTKRNALAKQKRLSKEAELRSPRFTRFETRPDGRKVFFHTFMQQDDKIPVVFSTLGNYDVVLMQIPYDEESEEKAKKKAIPHRDLLQAFAELEKLFPTLTIPSNQ